MTTWTEQKHFVRDIKGAAASILWILVISGRCLTNLQLEGACNYSGKPIAKALANLEERRIVTYHGRRNGWSLAGPLHQLPLPFAELPAPQERLTPQERPQESAPTGGTMPRPDGSYPQSYPQDEDRTRKNSGFDGQSRNFSGFDGQSRKNSGFDENSAVVVDLKDKEQDLKQQQQQEAPPTRKNSGLATLLRRIGINGAAFTRLVQHQADPAAVLAWYWYALSRPGIINPPGYAIRRIDGRETPPQGFLELARVWPALSPADRETLRQAATGNEDGRITHPPAQTGVQMHRYLDDPSGLTHPALDAYLSLLGDAPEELA